MALIDKVTTWWTCDELSGYRFDSHGSQHLPDLNSAGYAAGKKGNALLCEPASMRCVSGLTTLRPYGKSFSVSCWVYPTGVMSNRGIVTFRGSTSQIMFSLIDLTGSQGQLRFQRGSSWVNSGVSLPQNQWSHIVCRYNASTSDVRIDTNGTLSNQGSNNSSIANVDATVTIGGLATVSSFTVYNGRVDEVVYCEEWIDDAEVAELFNDGDGLTYADISAPPDPAIGSGIAQAIARSSGSGYTLHGGGGKARAIATSAGSGYTARTGSGAAQAIAASIGSGYTLRSGYGPAPAVARSEGSGYTQRKGSGIGQAIAESHGAGYTSRSGSGPAPAIVDSHATGYTARTGSGPAPAIATSQGVGYVRRTGSGRAPAIAWSRGHGYTARGGSGLARAIARSQGSGYTLRGGFGTARAFARSTGHGIAPGPTPMPTRHQGVRLRLRLPTRLQNRL